MKTLFDGTQVSSRSYYYLLDWNEQNEWYYMAMNFNKNSLKDLTILEYLELFQYATENELESFKNLFL